jgi:hypothetical protein
MNINSRSGKHQQVIRVREAMVEDVFQDRNTGFVKISYARPSNSDMIHMDVVVLVVGRDTVLQNQFGQEILFLNIHQGMTVNAEFSTMMTASEPPQARAFKIVAFEQEASSNVVTDRILMVAPDDDFFITGSRNDMLSQIRFNVTPETVILNQRGRRIGLCSLMPGDRVRVEHAIAMTMSIPPQTVAYKVQLV